jgi:ABC-2 type transport system permease protein
MIRLIRAEFTKLTTTRLLYGMAAAMAAFAVLIVAANAAGVEGAPPLSAYSLPVLVAAPVTLLSGAALLLGIVGMAGEFRHQTVTQTFLVTPDRGRVVAAKLVAYPLAGIALTLTILAFTAAVAAGWLAAKGLTPSLLDARLLALPMGHVLLGAVLAAGLCGLVGVGVAALVRNQVAALVGVAVWVRLVEGLLMSLLNAPSLGKWLPSAAAAALTNPGGAQLSRLAGSLLLAAYALALALAGTRLVVRRDITEPPSSGRRPLVRAAAPGHSLQGGEHHGIAQNMENGNRRAAVAGPRHHRHPGHCRGDELRPPAAGPLLQAGRRLPDQDLRHGPPPREPPWAAAALGAGPTRRGGRHPHRGRGPGALLGRVLRRLGGGAVPGGAG